MLERAALRWPVLSRPLALGLRLGRTLSVAALWIVSLAMIAGIALLVASLVPSGVPELSLDFLLEAPRGAGLEGGISTVLVSSALLLGIALLAAGPIALCAGAFLAAYGQRSTRKKTLVRISLDVLAGLPSVVFGLFGNALFCRVFGLGFSLLSGGLTLACMVLPMLVRATEQALLDVPREYRAASHALGLSRASSLLHVELPAARTGILAGVLLSAGRALSETAALIFTSGYVTRMPDSLLDSGRSMSVHIYDLAMNVPGGSGRANATALLLVGIVLLGAGFLLGSAHQRGRAD
jgi:phosphate transport system permease protein